MAVGSCRSQKASIWPIVTPRVSDLHVRAQHPKAKPYDGENQRMTFRQVGLAVGLLTAFLSGNLSVTAEEPARPLRIEAELPQRGDVLAKIQTEAAEQFGEFVVGCGFVWINSMTVPLVPIDPQTNSQRSKFGAPPGAFVATRSVTVVVLSGSAVAPCSGSNRQNEGRDVSLLRTMGSGTVEVIGRPTGSAGSLKT